MFTNRLHFFGIVYENKSYNISMKNRWKLLLLSPILLSMIGCNKNSGTPVDVVIISGQSNAVGCTKSRYLLYSLPAKYSEYTDGYEDVQIAYDCWTKLPPYDVTAGFESQNKSEGNNFVNVELGQGNTQEAFGPEMGISDALHEAHAGKLFLIKFACGASNLKDDWTKRNSPMYPKLIDYVNLQMNNLRGKGYNPTIKAFCWMQGEGDSYNGYYQQYLTNLREFVGNLRQDLGNIPFIDAGICTSANWLYPEQVNQAKVTFSQESENNFYIDTNAAGLHTNEEPQPTADLDHYDSASQIQLGKLFAQTFEQFLMK